MSNPDNLTRLRSMVELYEKEFQEAVNSFNNLGSVVQKNPGLMKSEMFGGFGLPGDVTRIVDLNGKLLNAYRGYVKELENFKMKPSGRRRTRWTGKGLQDQTTSPSV